MLDTLYQVERVLPELLGDEKGWNSVFADSEKPHLRRLWRQWNEYRINLHQFTACEPKEEFPHPHPWQMAVRILEGQYSMGTGISSDPNKIPMLTEHKVYNPGDCYEMLDADLWHAIRPIGEEILTIMVSGPPIFPQNRKRANKAVRELYPEERSRLFEKITRSILNCRYCLQQNQLFRE